MARITEILGNPDGFLRTIFSHLASDQIDVSNSELDHICYRVETEARYEELKNILETSYATLLSEAIIWDRFISTYRLNDPIRYINRTISILELPAPKPTKFYTEWYEHVEFVIDKSFDEFISEHPDLEFDTHSQWKMINPEISRNYQEGSVKFHHTSLEQVIKMEQ